MNVLTIFQILPCVRLKKGKNLIFRYLWTSRRFSRNLWRKILDLLSIFSESCFSRVKNFLKNWFVSTSSAAAMDVHDVSE